eukprot:UN07639
MDSDDFYHAEYVPWKVQQWRENQHAHLIGLEGITNAQVAIDGSLRIWYTKYDANCADGWLHTKDAANKCIFRKNKP